MKLVQHPNVVRLYEVIDTQTKLYLILELGDGGDMYDCIMKHDGGLTEEVCGGWGSVCVGGEGCVCVCACMFVYLPVSVPASIRVCVCVCSIVNAALKHPTYKNIIS